MASDWGRLPLSIDDLEAFRLEARNATPVSGVGAHFRRRLGQSLEFREYRDYQYGDDIRLVDWRVSARLGGRADWIARTFEAEERLTIAISIDPRPSMYLPDNGPQIGRPFFAASKMQVACWLLEALGEIVELDHDALIVHRLFHQIGTKPRPIDRGGAKTARHVCESLRSAAPVHSAGWDTRFALDADSLLTALPPASVLIVFSDLYFEDQLDAFIDMLIEAQTSYRQIVLVQLDSWPTERQRLLRGVKLLEGLEGVVFDGSLTEIDEGFVDEADDRLLKHVEAIIERAQAGGLVFGRWSWPAVDHDVADWLRHRFASQFFRFTPFKSVFMRPT